MITCKRYFNNQFRLEKPSEEAFRGLELVKHFWANSARTGLMLVFDRLGLSPGDAILLPAFSPHGIVLPAMRKRLKIVYYKLDDELKPDTSQISSLIETNANLRVIVMINYFGFQFDFSELIRLARSRNIFTIEDCAHTLVHDFGDNNVIAGRQGDVSLFSLPKLLPVPDGSLFIVNNTSLDFSDIVYRRSLACTVSSICNYLQLLNRTAEFKAKARFIQQLFGFFAFTFNALYYFFLCRMRSVSDMSPLSRRILQSLNIVKIIEARKTNVKLAYERVSFKNSPALKTTNPSSIVVGIPCIDNSGGIVQTKLRSAGIKILSYNKFWWFVPREEEKAFHNEKRIHDNNYVIPVNENITPEEMDHLVETVNRVWTDEHTL